MSGTLLEAMALGVPVLARRIPGNAAVVAHGVTGLLFDTPAEAVQLGQQLLRGLCGMCGVDVAPPFCWCKL